MTDGEGRQIDEIDAEKGDIGATVRRLRKAAGLTLDGLSKRSRLSRAAISKIERGAASPTYDTLVKLAEGLGTEIEALIAPNSTGSPGPVITRHGGGAPQADARYRHFLLAPDFRGRRLYAFETEVLARDPADISPFDRHASEDVIYVLGGLVAVHFEGHPTAYLAAGDALQMDGRVPHALVRRDDPTTATPPRVLWVSTVDRRDD